MLTCLVAAAVGNSLQLHLSETVLERKKNKTGNIETLTKGKIQMLAVQTLFVEKKVASKERI